eukprot:scaffold3464_cov406-Prasinococcus_capsulatus_cf.AAC.13
MPALDRGPSSGEIELREAMEREARSKSNRKKEKELEQDEEYQEAKARAWDDWKDDNPRDGNLGANLG